MRLGLCALTTALVATLAVSFGQPAELGAQGEKRQAMKSEPRQKADKAPRSEAEQSARDEAQRLERQQKAQTRALFATETPLPFSLIADFDALARDRDTLSTKRFPATLLVQDSLGTERRITVSLRTRGHFRLLSRNCRFVPIRIDFPDSGRKGTPFAAQKSLKLGTHCQRDSRYDDYTRREYLAYRVHGALTEHAFRARLATATYVDQKSGKTLETRTAMFIENEDEVARRLGGKIRELRGALFDDFAQEELLQVTLFEYLIGNTDWSLHALHNIRLAVLPNGRHIPLAYDFDFSGLVGAHYATPDPRLGIRTVRDRLFRGPCRPAEVVQPVVTRILAKREAMLAEVARVPGLSKDDQARTRDYLEEGFRVFANPGQVKQEILESCQSKPGV